MPQNFSVLTVAASDHAQPHSDSAGKGLLKIGESPDFSARQDPVHGTCHVLSSVLALSILSFPCLSASQMMMKQLEAEMKTCDWISEDSKQAAYSGMRLWAFYVSAYTEQEEVAGKASCWAASRDWCQHQIRPASEENWPRYMGAGS